MFMVVINVHEEILCQEFPGDRLVPKHEDVRNGMLKYLESFGGLWGMGKARIKTLS